MMTQTNQSISLPVSPWEKPIVTALLVLADGTVVEGAGLGKQGSVVGEICFNTALTGYQEILTDPSYSEQIVTFTFPHIGNVGANLQDIENLDSARYTGAVGAIFRADAGLPSSYRAMESFENWLEARGLVAMTGVDTRALTILLREQGALNGVIAHDRHGRFDLERLKRQAADWSGLIGLDLASSASSATRESWQETAWQWDGGYGKSAGLRAHIVVIDYGIKRNILRLLAARGARITVLGAQTQVNEILALEPDGIFLSNGPGDPAATAKVATPVIAALIEAGLPIFGICLGHQMLALTLGGQTIKMRQGHHGANHPVKDFATGKVEIVSMNHGFAVDTKSLPAGVEATHVSLFDGSNCGIRLKGCPVFSVQHHPEAAPGPQDSHYLFDRFFDYIQDWKNQKVRVGEKKHVLT